MIRDEAIQSIQAEELDLDDRSMRVIECATAFAAFVVVGILAFVR